MLYTHRKQLKSSFTQRLFCRVENSPLILFRILFGLLLFYHCITHITTGKVYELFIQPPFTFTFIGFEFLRPLPGNGMYVYFGFMSLLALMMATGAWYRFAAIAFTLLWTGAYLMQKVDYNNHHYLVILLCFFMCIVPAHRYFSIDVARKKIHRSLTCQQWVVWMFIAQLAIVYFFSALSKLSADWLSDRFIAYRFSGMAKHHRVGFVFGNHLFHLLIIYGGILFDFLIVPLLLWKKTRPYAFAVSCLFHLFNSFVFDIRIFPYLSIALNVFFFDPGIIRHIFFWNKPKHFLQDRPTAPGIFYRRLVVYGWGCYMLVQLLLPMRYLLFPGDVLWTEEGYKMSWKMMLRVKKGEVKFRVVDSASSGEWQVDPAQTLPRLHVEWLAISPDMIWQYVQRVKQSFARRGYPHVEIYVTSAVRLNGRSPLPLIRPDVNLAAAEWQRFRHSYWITTSPGE